MGIYCTIYVTLSIQIEQNDNDRNRNHKSNFTEDALTNFTKPNSLNGSKHLREIFDFSGTFKPQTLQRPVTVIIKKKISTTFRPTSSILYLHPPKPRHIVSMYSELKSIEFDITSTQLTLRWDIIVFVRHPNQREKRQTNNTTNNDGGAIAKVEEETNPLRWNIYIRRYGQTKQDKYQIVDQENNLNPPYTGNKSYEHRIEHLYIESSYELCIQSVNAGHLKQSQKIKEQFPIDAHSIISGRNNPLFICKEILIKPPDDDNLETELIKKQSLDNHHHHRNEIRGRLLDDGPNGSDIRIEMSEETADAFVVYTAISSGSTTVLLLIVVALFCCCRCKQRKTLFREHHQYNRAPTRDLTHF